MGCKPMSKAEQNKLMVYKSKKQKKNNRKGQKSKLMKKKNGRKVKGKDSSVSHVWRPVAAESLRCEQAGLGCDSVNDLFMETGDVFYLGNRLSCHHNRLVTLCDDTDRKVEPSTIRFLYFDHFLFKFIFLLFFFFVFFFCVTLRFKKR